MKNVIVLQHIAIEDPGYLKDLMQADGWNLVQIELDQGDAIPADLSGYDAMLCMGGPMDTWMEAEYPWLIEEKRRIREWVVVMGKPFLGFCLGCQLLGEVLGGAVVKSEPAEIGVLDINMTAAARDDRLFADYPATIKAVQWHSWEVRGLEANPEVTLLGSSDNTPCQIFRFRNNAWAIQFHVEVRADTVMQWGCIPEYKAALESGLGSDALASFDELSRQHMPEMNRLAAQLYNNFKQLLPD
jgi:GMP synthase-like glutamine amidotransferase